MYGVKALASVSSILRQKYILTGANHARYIQILMKKQ